MTYWSQRLLARFADHHVEFWCGTEWIADELRLRLAHLLTSAEPARPALLRLVFTQPAPACVELRDSTGRYAGGSLEHVLHHARKWSTAAFAAAHPELLWLHAAAAARNGCVIVLAGPAGSGKSTLVVRLIAHAWQLFADDVVPVRASRREALPLAFSPDVRTVLSEDGTDMQLFLEQPKTVVSVPSDRVASRPAPVGAIVFPEYSRQAERPAVTLLGAVPAACALASQCWHANAGRPWGILTDLFHLAQSVPCYSLRYTDATAAADALTGSWPPGSPACR